MVFFIASPFLLGAWVASEGWNVLLVLAGLAAVGTVLRVFKLWWCLLIFLFAACYFHLYADRQVAKELPFNKKLSFAAVVSDEPTESARYEIVPVTPTGHDSAMVDLFAPPDAGYRYGDLLNVTGKIVPPESADEGPAVFSPVISVVGQGKGFWLRADLLAFKAAVLQKLNDVLPQDEAALLGGVVIGGTQGMSAGLKNDMSLSGTSYIATMYGFKIAMIVFIAGAALLGRIPRRAVFAVTIVAIVLFVIMSGGNASALRAGIMAFLALAARESGRSLHRGVALAGTAFVMVAADPLLIASSAFQLSFLSVAGILYLAPPIKELIRYSGPGVLEWRESAVLASATLLAMMPVVLISYGSFSLTAFVSNTLVMPAVLPLAALGAGITLSGFVVPFLSLVLGKAAQVLLLYQLAIIKICAAIFVPLPAFFAMPPVVVIYYIALILFIKWHGQQS